MSEILGAFERQREAIRRTIAKYRRNDADIDELTQETFLKGFALEQKSLIDKPDRLLLRIAKNLAINAAQRKTQKMAQPIADFEDTSVYSDERQPAADDALHSRNKLYVVTRAIAGLSPELREALVMRRLDGLKFKDIAASLNVSVSTVEKRVAAALHACTVALRKEGFDDDGARRPPVGGTILGQNAEKRRGD